MFHKVMHIVRHPAHKPGTFNGKGYCIVGLLALVAFMMQALGHQHWTWLAALQGNAVYKQVSGFVLLAFIAYQWRFSVLRARGETHRALAMIKRHKWLGALAPLFFYVHSQGLGYAYTRAMTVVFFTIFLTGLCNFEILRIRKPWFQPTWVMVHVGLSSALLLLLGYHVYITYTFE